MKKNLSFLLTLGIMVMLLVGCTYYAHKIPLGNELVKSYSLGTTNYTAIGETMISFKYGKAYKMYEATETFYSEDEEVPGISKGDRWIGWFGNPDEIIILKENGTLQPCNGWYYEYGLRLEDSSNLKEKPFVAVFVPTAQVYAAPFTKYKKEHKSWDKDRSDIFKLLDEKYYSEENLFQSELLYNGREKDTVFLLYREYTGKGIARDAFYQQLRYNIKDSSVIKFKSLKIEILNATNERITFKVISDDNVPWMRVAE